MTRIGRSRNGGSGTARFSGAQRALEYSGPPRDGFAVANLTPLSVFQSSNVAKAFRDFRAFRERKKAAQQRRTPKHP
jgi:hypothetical protein